MGSLGRRFKSDKYRMPSFFRRVPISDDIDIGTGSYVSSTTKRQLVNIE